MALLLHLVGRPFRRFRNTDTTRAEIGCVRILKRTHHITGFGWYCQRGKRKPPLVLICLPGVGRGKGELEGCGVSADKAKSFIERESSWISSSAWMNLFPTTEARSQTLFLFFSFSFLILFCVGFSFLMATTLPKGGEYRANGEAHG